MIHVIFISCPHEMDVLTSSVLKGKVWTRLHLLDLLFFLWNNKIVTAVVKYCNLCRWNAGTNKLVLSIQCAEHKQLGTGYHSDARCSLTSDLRFSSNLEFLDRGQKKKNITFLKKKNAKPYSISSRAKSDIDPDPDSPNSLNQNPRFHYFGS